MKKQEYRCTRNKPYDTTGCPGHRRTGCRQGHYVFAWNPTGALAQLMTSYPDEIVYGFSIQNAHTGEMFIWDMVGGLRQVTKEEQPKAFEMLFEMAKARSRDKDISDSMEIFRSDRRRREQRRRDLVNGEDLEKTIERKLDELLSFVKSIEDAEGCERPDESGFITHDVVPALLHTVLKLTKEHVEDRDVLADIDFKLGEIGELWSEFSRESIFRRENPDDEE